MLLLNRKALPLWAASVPASKLIQFSLSQAPSTAQYEGFLQLQNLSIFQTVTL